MTIKLIKIGDDYVNPQAIEGIRCIGVGITDPYWVLDLFDHSAVVKFENIKELKKFFKVNKINIVEFKIK